MYVVDGKRYANQKEYLFKKQKGKCYYCAKTVALKKFTREHLIRKADGGRDGKNIVLACKPCNHGRGEVPHEIWSLVGVELLRLGNWRDYHKRSLYRFLKNKLLKLGIDNPKFYHRLLSFNNRRWKPLVIKCYRIRKTLILWKGTIQYKLLTQ